jgi:hypothetical protein
METPFTMAADLSSAKAVLIASVLTIASVTNIPDFDMLIPLQRDKNDC